MQDLKTIFRHCTRVMEQDGVYTPVRFSDERLRVYREEKPECPYACCPVGMSMEFKTDAEKISFSYRMTKIYYPVIVFDIYENGLFMRAVREPDGSESGTVEYTLQTPGAVVEIFFPIGADVTFFDIRIGKFTTVSHAHEPKLLVLGDSISQGLFGVNPSVSVIPLLARHYGYDYLNLSVGGEVFRPDLVEPELAFAPDRILVELGTNDLVFVQDIHKIRKNIDAFFAELKRRFPNTPVTVVSPFWQIVFAEGTDEMDGKLRTTLLIGEHARKVAAEYGHTALDGIQLSPHEQEFFSDHAHPSDKGFAYLALELIRRLDWR